jgi:menaquinone-dependent protoporphyrinogen oxidase
MNVLIVYGTRYGATTSTAEEIANILRTENYAVKVVNLKEEKIKDISPYELVIVGSGMQLGKWTSEAEDFLKKHREELSNKKLAIFASTMKMVPQKEGKPEEVEKIRKAALDDIITKYNLHPISAGFFGGVLNYNRMNFLFRRTLGALKPQLETDGFKETEQGVYELRDWDEIRGWAKELAVKAAS